MNEKIIYKVQKKEHFRCFNTYTHTQDAPNNQHWNVEYEIHMSICCFVYGAGKLYVWLRTVDMELSPALEYYSRLALGTRTSRTGGVLCNVHAMKTNNTFISILVGVFFMVAQSHCRIMSIFVPYNRVIIVRLIFFHYNAIATNFFFGHLLCRIGLCLCNMC